MLDYKTIVIWVLVFPIRINNTYVRRRVQIEAVQAYIELLLNRSR